jgi:O-acetyl-ADP-ribose deacetylase (regulator of RNase III)
MNKISVNGNTLELAMGDITREETDAIVNAANKRLAGGGGVDGAIHRAGGPEIMAECDRIRKEKGGCPTGEAVATTAGRLKAKFVIHTVGPVWAGGNRGEPEALENCYKNSLRLAAEKGCQSVAFPSISTGVYSFPIEKAAAIAIRTIVDQLKKINIPLVKMVLFSRKDFDIYADVLQKYSTSVKQVKDF